MPAACTSGVLCGLLRSSGWAGCRAEVRGPGMCLCASRNLQRLCSNPGKPPETLGKRIIDKYVYLQELCKPRKPLGAAAKSAATIGSQVHALPTTLAEREDEEGRQGVASDQ